MKADALARGGETFWLDMGAPVRIGDLVDRLIVLARQRGLPPVPVDIIGLRPGEKRAEQLTTQGLALCRTDHPRIWMARQAPMAAALTAAALPGIRRHVARGDALSLLKTLTMAVPDYEPSADAWAIARAERLHVCDDARERRTLVA
jgi:FlaA1/EpsC-like NDP-sugar epimerase